MDGARSFKKGEAWGVSVYVCDGDGHTGVLRSCRVSHEKVKDAGSTTGRWEGCVWRSLSAVFCNHVSNRLFQNLIFSLKVQ